jgi:hypothetical protein
MLPAAPVRWPRPLKKPAAGRILSGLMMELGSSPETPKERILVEIKSRKLEVT